MKCGKAKGEYKLKTDKVFNFVKVYKQIGKLCFMLRRDLTISSVKI